YTLLRPTNGWACALQIMGDPTKEFRGRYSALRAARFFREVRPSKVNQKDLIAGVCFLLQEPDMADLVIEDLRRWGCWDLHEKVLELHGQKEFGIPIVHRSIIRY